MTKSQEMIRLAASASSNRGNKASSPMDKSSWESSHRRQRIMPKTEPSLFPQAARGGHEAESILQTCLEKRAAYTKNGFSKVAAEFIQTFRTIEPQRQWLVILGVARVRAEPCRRDAKRFHQTGL